MPGQSHGGDHGRRVREEGEGADRWGHGVSVGASDALRGPRALERRAGERAEAGARGWAGEKERWFAGPASWVWFLLFPFSFLFLFFFKLTQTNLNSNQI